MTIKTRTYQFFRWLRDTLDGLCDRENHLQRLGVIGAGASLYPILIAVLVALWVFGSKSPELAIIALPMIFKFGVGIMILFGLVIVVMIGLVKGIVTLKAMLPNGASVEVETTNRVEVSDAD